MSDSPKSKRTAVGGSDQRLVRRLADIIADEVGFFNGWKVDAKTERGACERAARRILKMQRFRSPNAKCAGTSCPVTTCSALQKCAERVAGHIRKPLDIHAIALEIESDEYNADLMLQHLLLWTAKAERHLKNPRCVRAMALLGEIILPNAKDHSPIGAVSASKPESDSAAPIG